MPADDLATPANMLSALARCWIRGQLCIGVTMPQQAKRLGVTPQSLSKIKSRRQAVGPKLEQALAELLFGGSRDKMLAAARRHWESEPGARLPAVVQPGEPSQPGASEDSVVRALPTRAG
jgi:hypothetical protein